MTIEFAYAPRDPLPIQNSRPAAEIRDANWAYRVEWFEDGVLHVIGVGTLNLAGALAKTMHRRAACLDVTLIVVESDTRFCVLVDGFQRLQEHESETQTAAGV